MKAMKLFRNIITIIDPAGHSVTGRNTKPYG